MMSAQQQQHHEISSTAAELKNDLASATVMAFAESCVAEPEADEDGCCFLEDNSFLVMREQDADVLETSCALNNVNSSSSDHGIPLLAGEDEPPPIQQAPEDEEEAPNENLHWKNRESQYDFSNNHNLETTSTTQPPAQSTCEGIAPQNRKDQRSLLTRALQDVVDGIPRRMKRTDSKERRIHEAAQYEQAVGEPAPVCIIEDDDDEEDDEEEDEGVKHIHIFSLPKSTSSRLTHSNSYSPPTESSTRRRPRSVSESSACEPSTMILTQLPNRNTTVDFVYKGIRSNPPDIVHRGITRGNMAVLHRKAWLEVSDKYHRYGKHLRLYYRHWESIGYPTNQFFDWLDSKGEAAGCPLPVIPECTRATLDSDTVLYITNPDITEQYLLDVSVESGKAYFRDRRQQTISTGDTGWIFVLRDNRLYGAPKVTSVSGCSKQRFHHSSFFGGKAVAAAGIFITDETGRLTKLYPHSGHYRPGEAHMQRVLFFFYHNDVDLRTFDIDTQQIEHVARDNNNNGQKVSKLESLHLHSAITVALFLAHKAKCIRCGLFQSIHRILPLEHRSSVSGTLASIQ